MSDTPTECTVEVPSVGKKIIKTTNPNGVTEFVLTPGEGQPYERDISPNTAWTEDQTQINCKGKGIHVTSEAPVTVYGMSYFNNTTDTYLALPTSALGREYIVSSYADWTGNYTQYHIPSQTVIVAAYDNTSVTFKLGGSAGTKTVGGLSRGESKTYLMNKGDVVAFATKKITGAYPDLSGSKITATRPIAVISGNQCPQIEVTTGWSDYIAEMELPTHTWGKEYHITPVAKRGKFPFIKIFAKNPNTKLFRDGSATPFAVLSTSGGEANTGYFEGRILNDGSSPRPVTITADGPISISMFNTGQQDDNIPSDPFQMVLTPVEQYLKEVAFTVIEIPGTAKADYINLIFKPTSEGTMPDDLEIGTLSGSGISWRSVRTEFGASHEPINGSSFSLKRIQLNNGSYKIRCSTPIGAQGYALSGYMGYGHLLGAGMRDLSIADPQPPRFTYTQHCDGSVTNGKLMDFPTELAFRSNLAALMLVEGSSNYTLEQEAFVAGDAGNCWWKLNVKDPSKNATAILYAADRAGNDTTITITYAPPAISVGSNVLDFGLIKTDKSKTLQLVIRNTSQTQPQTITKLNFKNTNSMFEFVNLPSLPMIVDPSGQITFDVRFVSSNEGSFKNDVLIEANGCTTFSIALNAQTGTSIINATDADFGKTRVNTGVEKTIILKNNGSVPLTITGYVPPALSQFSLQSWPSVSESVPLVLQPAQEIQLLVNFQSATEGEFKDSIVFKSDTKITGVDSIAHLNGKAEKVVSVKETQDASFTISPNPATAYATITLPAFKSQNVFLKVFDALGNEVADFSSNLLKTELRFDTKTLPNGAYFLRFTDGKTMLSRSFIIQN